MPFTISHAAAVLPFSRMLARWRLLSAAIIGAMVPDFRVFFWHLPRFESHSASALLTFCLPLGLTCYWLFQYLIKAPIIEMLPDGAYSRWQRFASPASLRSARQWLLAAVGILGGALTHLVWDGFTHEGSRGVRMMPWLDDPVLDVGNHHYDGVRLLQDLSSIVGLFAVILIVLYGLRGGVAAAYQRRLINFRERALWILLYGSVLALCTLGFFFWARHGHYKSHSLIAVISDLAIASVRGSFAGLCAASVLMQGRLVRLRRAGSHAAAGPSPD
jgi:Domain of unknown function (DUF4184)